MKIKTLLLSLLCTIIIATISYYFTLPALNPTYFGFWVFILCMFMIFAIFYSLFGSIKRKDFRDVDLGKKVNIIMCSVIGIVCFIFLIDFILSPIFCAKSYSQRIQIDETGNFTDDVVPVDFTRIPLLDKDSSQKLGDRVMGQMPELVSQFSVSDLYTQINYNDQIIRVTPLEYADIFKVLSNQKDGIKGYISVNSVNGETNLTKLENGMKYMPSAIFGKDLYRHVQMNYVTDILGTASFEIDNDGNPYWVVPVLKYTGVNLKEDVSGVIIVNPINGDMSKYKISDVPTWVDHVYNADLIIEQVDNWGEYRTGFFNSIFGQKNVTQTTSGYNYTVMNDDVYLYTGITSAVADESNIGFILTNMRTKDTKYYAAPGAEEYSAKSSAEGQVQQMSYVATFPLLINLNNRPTYLISLKDNAGLVKMYAFVDVEDYQKVVVTDASQGIETAADNYLNSLGNFNNSSEIIEKDIVVKTITSAIIDNNTFYYIKDNENKKYRISIKNNSDMLPFVNSGDRLTVSYFTEGDVTELNKIFVK